MQNRRIAVRGIIVHNGKLLCVRHKKTAGKVSDEGKDYWCTPGGGVDVGEPLIPALERELIEETGVKPIVGRLLYVQQFQHNDQEQFEFFFHVENGGDYVTIDLEQSTHGAIELAEIDFIDPTARRVLPSFLSNVDLAVDIRNGTTQVFNNFDE